MQQPVSLLTGDQLGLPVPKTSQVCRATKRYQLRKRFHVICQSEDFPLRGNSRKIRKSFYSRGKQDGNTVTVTWLIVRKRCVCHVPMILKLSIHELLLISASFSLLLSGFCFVFQREIIFFTLQSQDFASGVKKRLKQKH